MFCPPSASRRPSAYVHQVTHRARLLILGRRQCPTPSSSTPEGQGASSLDEDEDPQAVVAMGAAEEVRAPSGNETAAHHDRRVLPWRPATFWAVDDTCVRRMPTLTGFVAMTMLLPVPSCPLLLSPHAHSRPVRSMA